jgi:hypothetical protein
MAKKPKKTTKPVEEVKQLPLVKNGEKTFIMSDEEIVALVMVLGLSKEMFKELALNYAKLGDSEAEELYNARSMASEVLFNKVRGIASIGEPESRVIH